MKGTRHSEEQIITILKQGEAGLATAELCRQHGITEQTYYRWKAKYGGMDSGEAKKLKQLEEENRKLKHVVADLTLDNRALKDGHLSIKLCLSDSCGGLETRLEHGIELVKYGSDILGQAFPFALLERRDGDAELEL